MTKLIAFIIFIIIVIFTLWPTPVDNTLDLQKAINSGGLKIDHAGPGYGHYGDYWNSETGRLETK